MIRSLLPVIAGSYLLVGCASSFEAIEIGPSKVQTDSRISDDRKSWVVTLKNMGSTDAFCPRLAVRVIFDNPLNYLEMGESVELVADRYVRRGDGLKLRGNVPGGRLAHIRSVSIIDPVCEAASVYHFCTYAEKTPEEKDNLTYVGEKVGARTCADLRNLISKFDRALLRHGDKVKSRPFNFRFRA